MLTTTTCPAKSDSEIGALPCCRFDGGARDVDRCPDHRISPAGAGRSVAPIR
jgi:hypothetical protein